MKRMVDDLSIMFSTDHESTVIRVDVTGGFVNCTVDVGVGSRHCKLKDVRKVYSPVFSGICAEENLVIKQGVGEKNGEGL